MLYTAYNILLSFTGRVCMSDCIEIKKKYIIKGGGVAPAPELDRFLLNYFSIQ